MALAYLDYPSPVDGFFALFLLVALVSGLAMSAVGVGGVLLVPTLLLYGVPAKVAVSAVLCACVFSGMYSTYLYSKKGSMPWRNCFLITATIAPSAAVAAALLPVIPNVYLKILICVVCTMSGCHSVYKNCKQLPRKRKEVDLSNVVVKEDDAESIEAGGPQDEAGEEPQSLRSDIEYLLIGIFVGFGSVWTGTTGPVFLFPCLFLIKPQLKTTHALGMGNFVAMPISICSTVFSVLDVASTVDIYLALIIALCLLASNPAGVHVAHTVDPLKLKLSISFMLIVVGLSTLIQLVSAA